MLKDLKKNNTKIVKFVCIDTFFYFFQNQRPLWVSSNNGSLSKRWKNAEKLLKNVEKSLKKVWKKLKKLWKILKNHEKSWKILKKMLKRFWKYVKMSYSIMSTLKNCTARQLRLQKTRVWTPWLLCNNKPMLKIAPRARDQKDQAPRYTFNSGSVFYLSLRCL